MTSSHKKLRLAITIISILLIISRFLFFPDIELDTAILFLLAFAVFPWLAPIISSVEVPGLKIEFKDLEAAKKEAKEVGLLAYSNAVETKLFPAFVQNDPNLALAGLRIAIEDHLRKLVGKNNEAGEKTLNQVLDRLRVAKVITDAEYNVLTRIIWLLDQAVHGAEVDSSSVQWAKDVGPLLIKALDEKSQNQLKNSS
ncbi:MAG: hypothetical protein QY302_14890 [Anaerolineales bacterium]|nr:MAG: hypothetical protein QY302_14890 [Anaerolineales bacterium]